MRFLAAILVLCGALFISAGLYSRPIDVLYLIAGIVVCLIGGYLYGERE